MSDDKIRAKVIAKAYYFINIILTGLTAWVGWARHYRSFAQPTYTRQIKIDGVLWCIGESF